MDLLTSSIERLKSKYSSINASNIAPNLTQRQDIFDSLLTLKDSLRDLSAAGIDHWRRGDTTDIVAWFKQSLTTGFGYLDSTILGSISKIDIARYLSLGRGFLREPTLAAEYLKRHGSDIEAWLTQSRNLPVIWIATFAATLTALSCIGFRRTGIGKGTPAASFQSHAYGPYTPRGGSFAKLTSLGMLGRLMPVKVWASVAVASVVTWRFVGEV